MLLPSESVSLVNGDESYKPSTSFYDDITRITVHSVLEPSSRYLWSCVWLLTRADPSFRYLWSCVWLLTRADPSFRYL